MKKFSFSRTNTWTNKVDGVQHTGEMPKAVKIDGEKISLDEDDLQIAMYQAYEEGRRTSKAGYIQIAPKLRVRLSADGSGNLSNPIGQYHVSLAILAPEDVEFIY